MKQLAGSRRARYELVTAAHEFILTVLPFRHPGSRSALARFVDTAARCRMPVADVDAVLLDVLSVLHPHAGGRLPSLVDRYVAQRRHLTEPLARFRECVEDVIRYRGVGSRDVQRAVAIIERRYTDCMLTQAAVAGDLDLLPEELSTLFKRHTGLTFTEYVRALRLDRAASLLTTTDRRIKDIWVEVGYNDASHFDHQFKDRFGTPPPSIEAAPAHSRLRL
jgi:AraC-like DNA-binding protein